MLNKTLLNLFIISIFSAALSFSAKAQSWNDLNEQMMANYNAGKIDSAILYGKQALELAKKEGGDMFNYTISLNNIAGTYQFLGEYENAEPLYLEALAIRKKMLGTDDPHYGVSLNNLGSLYQSMGKYAKAEPLFVEALAISKKTVGVNKAEYATPLNNLASLYFDMGYYEKAEKLFSEALAIRRKILGIEHREYAASLNNLATLYEAMGNNEKAEPLFDESLAILKKTLGVDHPEYAKTLDNMAGLCESMGNYEKAERLYEEALLIRKKNFGTENRNYAYSLNNIALLSSLMGNFSKAVLLNKEALQIRKKILGTEHPEYATSLNNLGALYEDIGDFAKAELFYVEAMEIRKKILGNEHPDYAASLNNIASLNQKKGNYQKAEPLFAEAMAIRKVVLGTDNPIYAASLSNMGILYYLMGSNIKSEQAYIETIRIRKKNLGVEHPDYINSLTNLAVLYYSMGKYTEAEQLNSQANTTILKNIRQNFQFLSELEKEKYLSTVTFGMEIYQSIVRNPIGQNPSISGTVYDINLASKGMILTSRLQIKNSILSSGNKEAINLYDSWNNIKEILAKEFSTPVAKRTLNTDSLENQANSFEKKLSQLSTTFNQSNISIKASWKTIQQKMKIGEVAIEFASFRYHNGKHWTDTTYYSAVILRKEDTYPTLINLCREDQLDSLLHKNGRSDNSFIAGLYRGTKVINNNTPLNQKKLYQLIWKPIEKLLYKGDHVYFSPSGLLHQVAFAAIPDENGELISDKYDLSQLSSTATLLQPPKILEKKDLSLVAFGGIKYDAKEAEMKATVTDYKQTETVSRMPERGGDRGTSWEYLPGTMVEIENIAKLANKNSIPITSYSGASAMEERYKGFGTIKSPGIIHISTHGFFFPDPKNKARNIDPNGESKEFQNSSNPLNRSGLLFAGANSAWKDENSLNTDLEDGILTAYEVANVNLSNTQLVALSACETGLGDIKGSEGVFGLQRAFKLAGADYLLMSLWKVPDAETAEFMTTFYGALFSGLTIDQSFLNTQTFMKKKYKNEPYKWAAFVLLR